MEDRSQDRASNLVYCVLSLLTQGVWGICLNFSPQKYLSNETLQKVMFFFKILGDKGLEPTISHSIHKEIFWKHTHRCRYVCIQGCTHSSSDTCLRMPTLSSNKQSYTPIGTLKFLNRFYLCACACVWESVTHICQGLKRTEEAVRNPGAGVVSHPTRCSELSWGPLEGQQVGALDYWAISPAPVMGLVQTLQKETWLSPKFNYILLRAFCF